jgi:hypothetical protein
MSMRFGRGIRPWRWFQGFGPVVVLLGLACAGGGAQTRTPSPSDEALSLDRQVVFDIDITAGKVGVEPPVFLQRLGGGVDFVAKGLADGYTLEIDFKTQEGARGPFARAEGAPARGRYTLNGKTSSLPSGRSEKAGVWKYEVVLRDAHGDDVYAVDPMGVFR